MTMWKWDADADHPLTTERIPVTSMWPRWGYFAALDKGSPRPPTRAEVRILASYIAYIRQEYQTLLDTRQIPDEPFDWHPNHNTVVFHKYAKEDWACQRRMSERVRLFPPSPRASRRVTGPLTLVQLMNRVQVDPATGHTEQAWHDWQAQHPETFGNGHG